MAGFVCSSLLGWKWISARHNGGLRRVRSVVFKPCLRRPGCYTHLCPAVHAAANSLTHRAFLIATLFLQCSQRQTGFGIRQSHKWTCSVPRLCRLSHAAGEGIITLMLLCYISRDRLLYVEIFHNKELFTPTCAHTCLFGSNMQLFTVNLFSRSTVISAPLNVSDLSCTI